MKIFRVAQRDLVDTLVRYYRKLSVEHIHSLYEACEHLFLPRALLSLLAFVWSTLLTAFRNVRSAVTRRRLRLVYCLFGYMGIWLDFIDGWTQEQIHISAAECGL